MSRVGEYRAALRRLPRAQWSAYLRGHSGLPGPRGNIELAQAFAEEADAGLVDEVVAADEEFLVFCGVVSLGRQLAERPDDDLERRLRDHARDGRWRVREGVAMGLQRLGDADPDRLLDLVSRWVDESDPLVLRAAAAGICEPRLLGSPQATAVAVDVCDRATRRLADRPPGERRTGEVRTLRQGLGYCWSVAVAADPSRGLPRFLAWEDSPDPDVAWIVRENRKKARLARYLS